MCHIRISRRVHPKFINIEQNPPEHHFCSVDCKRLWIDFVRECGYIPKAFIEIIGKGVRERI